MKFAAVIRSRWRVLLPVALLIGLLAVMLGWLLLPLYLERSLLPGLARPFGLELSLTARRIGLTGADFADLRLNRADAAPAIDSIRVDYRAGYPLRVSKITVSGLRLTIDCQDGRWRVGGIPFDRFRADAATPAGATGPKAAKSPLPASLKLEVIELRDFVLRLDYAGKSLELPGSGEFRFEANVIRFHFSGTLGNSQLSCAGTLDPVAGTVDFELQSPQLATADLALIELPAAAIAFAAKGRFAGGVLDAEINGTVVPNLPGLTFAKPLESRQTLHYQAGKLRIEGRTKPFTLQYAGTRQAELSGETFNTIEFESGKAPVFTLKPAAIRSEIGNLRLRLGDTQLRYCARRLSFETAFSARLDRWSLRLPKISGDFPLDAPAIDFGSIQLNGQEVAHGTLRAGLKDQVYAFNGAVTSAEYPNLRIKVDGSAPAGDFKQAVMTVDLPPWRPPEPIAARQFSAKAPDLKLNGTVSAGVTLYFERGAPMLAGSVGVSDGEAYDAKGNLKISGLSLDCRLLDLIALRTAPSQHLSVKSITFGRFQLTDAEIRFQADSPQDFLIESSRIGWCGGNLQSRAVRLYAGQRTLRTIIYCDNINLAEALKQLGVIDAEGEGVLSGQIPLRINAEGVTFEPGYLHSDPGLGGTIRIGGQGGEMLSAMTDSVDEARLLREALKSFQYQWAKLHLSTDRENLKLNLLFDGKPAGPLPFVQDQETGRLTYHAGGKASFQGLQLNLNLSLPLNRLLKVNQLFQ